MQEGIYKWFFLAFVVSVVVVLANYRRFKATSKSDFYPNLEILIKMDDPVTVFDFLKTSLPEYQYHIFYCSSMENKLIVESPDIGLFHWGFLYFISPTKEGLNVGILGKGPNPPNKKALQKHLDAFCLLLKEIMQPLA